MKACLPLLIAAFLATTAPMQAQNAAGPPGQAKPVLNIKALTAVEVDADGVITLQPGTVPELVAQVEKAVHVMTLTDNDATMPNCILAPGVTEVVVTAPLRLRNVSPVQALALVAAAAGCKLEPIIDPEGNATKPPPASPETPASPVIGYRIEMPADSPSYGMMFSNRSVAAQPTATLKFSSNLEPARHTPTMTARITETPVPAPVMPNPMMDRVKIVDSVSNPALVTIASGYGSMSGGMGGARGVPDDGPSVRVYAIGTILRGEPQEAAAMQDAFETLVAEAMKHAEADSPNPVLSFHRGTKALLVKGTAKQHAIIEQIIQAMKENVITAPEVKPRGQ
jgi:hypothetical protein